MTDHIKKYNGPSNYLLHNNLSERYFTLHFQPNAMYSTSKLVEIANVVLNR